MKRVIILRYGEIHLKGRNRGFFERILFENLKNALKNKECEISRIAGRYKISDYAKDEEQNIIAICQNVFGFVSLSPAYEVETDIENIKQVCQIAVEEFNINKNQEPITFKVATTRADKSFPIRSDEFSAQLGELVLNLCPNFKVKLKEPDVLIEVEIRENRKSYVFLENYPCQGGMPVGTSGTGLLMLSGGIDSPVAGYMMAKRGLKINAIHFHSYPYTSLKAKEKVLKLAEKLSAYTGPINVFLVPFRNIQEEIHKNCEDSFMINIMRRIMFRIAEKICDIHKFQTIITGENLGQVASQTIESLTNTNSVMEVIPIMRPLIAYDKIEIISIAKKIGTFETSILPYEDCCTVFLPENPVIKPSIEKSIQQENYLNIDDLINQALQNIEVIKINKK